MINLKQITQKLTPILITLLFFFSNCQKSPINGYLDGQWQVTSVSPEPDECVLEVRLYYCFYMHVCMLSYYGGTLTTGNMHISDNKLYLDFPNGNGLNTITALKQYGIYSNPVIFEIKKINNENLILRDGERIVTLRKF